MTKREHKRKAGDPIARENAARTMWQQGSWGTVPGTTDEDIDRSLDERQKYESAMQNPTGVYDHPHSVVRDEALDILQKREILEIWAAEAVHLRESEAEGSDGDEKSQLTEINEALKTLRSKEQLKKADAA